MVPFSIAHGYGKGRWKFLGYRGFQVPDDYVDEISPLGAERAAVYTIERFGLNEDKDDIVRGMDWNGKKGICNRGCMQALCERISWRTT